jgi:hypothetical protein
VYADRQNARFFLDLVPFLREGKEGIKRIMGVGECAFNRKGRRGMHAELRRGSIRQHVSRQNQMIADLCDFSALGLYRWYYHTSLNPLTPPEMINFIAAGPGILSGLIFSLGTK